MGDPHKDAAPSEDGGADAGDTPGPDKDAGPDEPGVMSTVKCGDTACAAEATCKESSGKPKCACRAGYTGDGKTCKNIDECAKDNGGCDDNAMCVDSKGGFDCVCKNGFVGDGSSCEGVDECSDDALNTCDPNAQCSDTGDGFECTCDKYFSGDGFGCGDVDECAKAATFTCDDHASCHNNFGGYGCVCDPGYDGDGKSCDGLCASKQCTGNVLCQVIEDEATCSATTCAVGYVGDGTNCVAVTDDDDCGTCDDDGADDVTGAVCTGMPGSGTCTCAPGYDGDGTTCTDENECDTDNGGCGDADNNRCTNLPGGYFCGCQAGYEKNGSGECVDIDECDAGASPCHPNAKCTNKTPEQNEQGFECACNAGYSGDGTVCKDVNECDDGDDNCLSDGTATCVNTNGGFDCRCKRGYTGDGVEACDNVDECDDEDANDCNDNADCTDRTPEQNPKGFECTCKTGFIGDGRDCDDVNECDNAALFACPTNASCFNDTGGYHCGCEAGKNLVESDSGSCYCDLSGFWAMRQNVDTCWEAVRVAGPTSAIVINAGKLKSTVWELHKYTYDGEMVQVAKKGCGTNKDLDFVGTALATGSETYASYVPNEVYYPLAMVAGKAIPEADIAPGSMFTTPKEASLGGINLGPDPENASWPAAYSDILPMNSTSFPRWEDTDGDGEPGFTLWSRLPSQTTTAGNRMYSYLPVNTTKANREVCASQALRVITQNVTDVESCTRMTGTVNNLESAGHIGSCMQVGSANEDNEYTCEAGDWADANPDTARCTTSHLNFLDEQSGAGQATNGPNCGGDLATATFELVKIGELDDDVGCEDVIEALPAAAPY